MKITKLQRASVLSLYKHSVILCYHNITKGRVKRLLRSKGLYSREVRENIRTGRRKLYRGYIGVSHITYYPRTRRLYIIQRLGR